MDDIQGLENLTDAEQKEISVLLNKHKLDDNTKLPPRLKSTGIRSKTHPQAPNPSKRVEPHKGSAMQVIYTNADVLTTTKLDELREIVQEYQPSIVAVNEVIQKTLDLEVKMTTR